MTLAVFRKALGIDKDELTPGEKTTFAERARSFLADNERGKRVLIRLCGKEYTLGPTRPDGHLSVQLKVANQAIENSLLRHRRYHQSQSRDRSQGTPAKHISETVP